MQQRRGTAAQWTAANPILAAGEIGFETDTTKFKMGNGSSTWANLKYFTDAESILGGISNIDLPATLDTLNELAAALGDDPQFLATLNTNIGLKAPINNPTFTGTVGGVTKSMVGLGNVDNTTDANKPVSTAAQTALDLKAPLASPALSGVPTAPTAMAATNTTQIATTEFVQTKINNLVNGAPGLLDTLDELAQALGDDANFASTVTNNLALKADATYVDGALTAHASDTTLVHGIADTSLLATTANVQSAADGAASALSTHASDTTLVHGIADTSLLATLSDVEGAADAAASALSTHASDTTSVHGIADTTLLVTTSDLSAHASETENVHGIADTTVLVTQQELADAISTATVDQEDLAGVGIDWNTVDQRFDIDSTVATKTYADDAVSTHNNDTTNVHGIADTADLATKSYADTAEADAITAAGTAADTKISTALAALTKSSVGLGNVDNTADASKPVSTAQAAAIATAKSEAIASATAQVDALLTGAPAALNTLDELAAALGDDANFASTVTTNLGLKAPLANPTFTGTVTVAAAGVAFTDGTQTKEGVPSRTPIIQKSSAYTLSALTERDSLIEVSAAGVITVPTDATLNFPIGTSIDILQTGTGEVSVAPVSGTVTINATPGRTLRTQWSSATLFKRAANTWVLFGDLK